MSATSQSTEEQIRNMGGGDRQSELHRFIADVEDLLGRVRGVTGEEVDRVRTRVQDSMRSARSIAMQQSQRARDASRAAAASADDYARTNPWVVAGVATMIGLALGALVSRR